MFLDISDVIAFLNTTYKIYAKIIKKNIIPEKIFLFI